MVYFHLQKFYTIFKKKQIFFLREAINYWVKGLRVLFIAMAIDPITLQDKCVYDVGAKKNPKYKDKKTSAYIKMSVAENATA